MVLLVTLVCFLLYVTVIWSVSVKIYFVCNKTVDKMQGCMSWRVQSRHGCLWNTVAKSTPSLASTRIYDGHGSFVPRMMHAVDWYPTILKLAGLQPGKCIDVGAYRSCVWSLARWRHWGGGGGGSCLVSAVRVVNVHGSGCAVSEKAPDTDDMLLATSCKDKYSLHTHAVLDCTSSSQRTSTGFF